MVRAGRAPLNLLDFASLGAFPTAAGTFTFDTSNLTLTGPGITTPIQGSLSTTGVAVFDFNAITVASDQVFVSQYSFSGVTTPPLALLSRGDITIDGKIDVRPSQPFTPQLFSPGGPGGFGSDSGPGAGGAGGTTAYAFSFSNPGGGGFDGSGGNGGRGYSVPGMPPVYQFVPFGGGQGGSSYGDSAASLQGGNGGGSYSTHGGMGYGGGGGGAIEIGAIGRISVGGSISANGSSGSEGGGGGSGGGIFLHGDSVTLSSSGVLSS